MISNHLGVDRLRPVRRLYGGESDECIEYQDPPSEAELEGGSPSNGSSLDGALPAKRHRASLQPRLVELPSDVELASDDESTSDNESDSDDEAVVSDSDLESSSGDESWAESGDESYASGLETDDVSELEGEPARKGRKSKPKLTEFGWRSIANWWNWRRNRTDCLEADEDVCKAHAKFFPLEDTHAAGFEVVSGYDGGQIIPGAQIKARRCAKVIGVVTGEHNITSVNDPDAVDELRECLTFNKTLQEAGIQQTSTVRLLARVGKGAADWLGRAPSRICEEIQQRREEFQEGVHVGEVKMTDYGTGDGIGHSDGTGATDLTACKVIMKPLTGGTLLTQGVDSIWRFVQITSMEYVLLSTTAGARLHSAARFVLVEELDDGTLIFEAAGDERVLSIVINIGPPGRGEDPAPFLEAARGFAGGYAEGSAPPEDLPPPPTRLQRSGHQWAAKVAAWKELMAAEHANAEVKAAAKAATKAVEAQKKAAREVARKAAREAKAAAKAEAKAARKAAKAADQVSAPSPSP